MRGGVCPGGVSSCALAAWLCPNGSEIWNPMSFPHESVRRTAGKHERAEPSNPLWSVSVRPGGVVQVQLGGDAVSPFVALDASGEPQLAVRRRGEERLAERAVGEAEADRLYAPAVVPGDDQPEMAAADHVGLDDPDRARRHPRRRPADAVGAAGFQRVAEGWADPARRNERVEQQGAGVEA